MDIQIVNLSSTDLNELKVVFEFLGMEIPEEVMESEGNYVEDDPIRSQFDAQMKHLLDSLACECGGFCAEECKGNLS